MDDPVVQVNGLEKSFAAKRVLRGLDLSIPRGSVVGLLGKNGAGKSTLLRCLVGLANPDAGNIRVFAQDPRCFNVTDASRIGYVAQQPRFPSWLTARTLAQQLSAIHLTWDQALVELLFLEWQVQTRQPIGVLSAGQLQKLAIILALAHRPELLVLDEPAAGMDPLSRRRCIELLIDRVADGDLTVLLSTHLVVDLERVADRIVILSQGSIAFDGELSTLKESISRLRLTGSNLPLAIPGAISYERLGDAAVLTMRGETATVATSLRDQGYTVDSFGPLSLEEIFLETQR